MQCPHDQALDRYQGQLDRQAVIDEYVESDLGELFNRFDGGETLDVVDIDDVLEELYDGFTMRNAIQQAWETHDYTPLGTLIYAEIQLIASDILERQRPALYDRYDRDTDAQGRLPEIP